MAFQSGAFQSSGFQVAGESNRLRAIETGSDSFSGSGAPVVLAALAAIEAGADVASFSLSSVVSGSFAAQESGADVFAGQGARGQLIVRESGADVFSGAGDSEGQITFLPTQPAGGVAYLIEMHSVHRETGVERLFTFSTDGFNSLPSDIVSNAHYPAVVKNAGSYQRSLFAEGTTSGEISVGYGYIELVNDGSLDELWDYAFDGYNLRILAVSRLRPIYAEAQRIFSGTVEQVELSWASARILIRDRLAELDVALQPALFAGTTVSGGLNEAEGQPDDLKGKPKPLTYGAPPQVIPATANPFDKIYSVGNDGLDAIVEVRDKGVAIPAMGADYTTVAALRTATITAGHYATALNLGLFRLETLPQGQVTCAPVKGSGASDRTAAQLARLVLLKAGLVEGTNFLASDIAALDDLNSAEIGYFVGTEEEKALDVVRKILGSIGATVVPNRLGVFRLVRFSEPSGLPVLTLTAAELLEGNGGSQTAIRSLATGDDGRGVPAWKVSVRYAFNGAVMSNNELASINVTQAFRTFAPEEWRTAVAADDAVKAIHKLSPELSFDTYLLREEDAQAEADRLLALHSVRRDRFQVTTKSYLASHVDLNQVVRLQVNRFGLNDGRDFSVIGITENNETGTVVLDLWG